MRRRVALTALTALALTAAAGADRSRLTPLDGGGPYDVGLHAPKLVTPQWVGEDGVEAVVVLAVDDLREGDVAKYEAFLRPVLDRLKAVDGRAPVSVMTCSVKPDDPRVQAWLGEGLALDVHTLAHPCPLLGKGDLAAARRTFEGCVDLLNRVPGNRPVAFRVPCCDSLNTPSPRFFADLFNKTTPAGHYLTIDSSVFNILTPADPALPRDLVQDPDGGERFRKYLPFPSFVNTVENYPYPYIIGRLCWEFPCVVPSDWEAQNLHKSNNPRTVEDLKAALDAVVVKQGVFNLVFHPHGWIKSGQVVELIDHAVKKHGKKVKFLNFREAQERLDKNLLDGQPLRDPDLPERDNGVRLVDVNADGYLDVVTANPRRRETRLWDRSASRWVRTELPGRFLLNGAPGQAVRFGVIHPDGRASLLAQFDREKPPDRTALFEAYSFEGNRWVGDGPVLAALRGLKPLTASDASDGRLAALRDIDGDGVCELFTVGPEGEKSEGTRCYEWREDRGEWRPLPFSLPDAVPIAESHVVRGDRLFRDSGVRFVDLDEDGADDIVFSDDSRYGVYLFESKSKGWTRKVLSGKAGDPGALPKVIRRDKDGRPTDNGFWVHSRHLWWQNEDTDGLPDLVDRRSFNDLLKDVAPRGKSAGAVRESIRVRPGFRVELAASEPLVLDPIAFDWSADGRLWVVEMGDYPLGVDGKGRPGGQVRVLEDTDQDGRYDKATVFLDRLGFPTGLMPWRGGVLVACAPDIFYAEDRDGDGKADVREVLFTGFHPGNQQHRLNGFELGLDGWVYGANGDSGGVVRSIKTGKSVDIRGRDFRFRPDDGRFEPESGMTQYGRHRDDWGRWFGDNNPTWAWQYVLADADLRRNPLFAPPDPRRVLEPDTRLYPVSRTLPRFNDPGAANRATSANSPTPYRDDLFGPHFENSLFVSEPVHNLVHRLVLEPDGGSPVLRGRRAVGEAGREFLASSDGWFRPTMLKTGPDGALWVADMDRAVIEHPEWIPDDWEKTLDLRAGHDRGRVFRVVPVDKSPRPVRRLDTLDLAGLVAALDSPNGWQRDTAQRLLLHRNDHAAAGLLGRLAEGTRNPKARVQALWVLENLGDLTDGPVLAALADPHPQVRRNAVRVSESLLPVSKAVAEAVLETADDADPSVRFQLALTLGNWDDPQAGRALASLARRDGSDPWFRAAVLSSAPPHAGALLTGLLAGPGVPPPDLVGPLFALAGGSRDRAGLASLVKAIATPSGPGGRFAAWQFSALAGLIDASHRAGKSPDVWAGGNPGPTLDPVWTAARARAADATAPAEDRLAALSLFGRDPRHRDAERGLLAELLKPQVPVGVQLAAVSAAARGRDPNLPEALLGGWKGYSPPLRSAVLDTILSRGDWVAALLSSLEDGRTPPTGVDPAHRRRLTEHADPHVRGRAAAVFGPGNGPRRQVVEAYRGALTAAGDPAAGAAVFRKVCAACHKLNGAGTDVGPDLAALDDRSPEALLTAVLDPSRAFEAKYTEYTVQLTDGRVKTGMIASESASALTLRRQQGEQDVILRTDVEAMAASGQSLMPEGLEKDVTPRDLADLIAYLNASASAVKPKSIAGNRPEVVTPRPDGAIVLKATAAEVYGDRLTFESRHGNLGHWASDTDRACWRFEAARVGRYEVWIDGACDDAAAGQTLTVRAGGGVLRHKVAGTGSWDNYQRTRLGTLELPAGAGRLEVRPGDPLRGPLIDLRAVELRPVAGPRRP